MNRNWKCPYCGNFSTIQDGKNRYSNSDTLLRDSDLGSIRLHYYQIVCPNHDCKKNAFSVSLNKYDPVLPATTGKQIFAWDLLPDSHAKPQPEYIPQVIRSDYQEACKILKLSPKASATLSRRCLQGMIRDFFKISKKTLSEEIKELKDKIDANVWEAIDSVRTLGNIGAHMEKDINTIIDVDINEAEVLIELIEQLFEEWYIAKYEREQRMNKVKQIATAKKAAKAN